MLGDMEHITVYLQGNKLGGLLRPFYTLLLGTFIARFICLNGLFQLWQAIMRGFHAIRVY